MTLIFFFMVTGANVQKSFKKMHNEFKLENVNSEIGNLVCLLTYI